MLKTLLPLVLLAAPVHAESFQLFAKGHWAVHYVVTEDTGPFCSASVASAQEGIYFSIDVSATDLTAWYISTDNNFGPTVTEGFLAVWVDRRGKWETPAYAWDQSIQMINLSRGFVEQLADGRKLYIDQDFDGQWDAWFSLQGSAAALYALADCTDKL